VSAYLPLFLCHLKLGGLVRLGANSNQNWVRLGANSNQNWVRLGANSNQN